MNWTKISDNCWKIINGPFQGSTCSYELKRYWVSWRGMTKDLGKFGGLSAANDALLSHPSLQN